MNPTTDIIKILRGLTGPRDLYTAFRDSIEMLALSIANGCDKTQFEAREARYLAIAKDYSREELGQIAHILGHLTTAMEAGFEDYLGQIFMQLDLGSDSGGQFFTPYDVCQLMAHMTIDEQVTLDALDARGYVSVHEPAVGAGGMVLAMEEVMRERDHPGVMHVTCVDIDIKAVHMAYLQLSLAGIPAIVIHGNTLSREQWSTWYTPVHIWQGWARKLRKEAEPIEAVVVPPVGQLDLFAQEVA